MLAVALAGQFLTPAAPPPGRTVVVPISSLALTCPALPADIDGLQVSITGALRSGSGTAQVAIQRTKPLESTIDAGEVQAISVTKPAAALFSADGPSAAQLVADANMVGKAASVRGYASYGCQAPSASQWIVGGSTTVGYSSVLYIANVDETAAAVDVELWSTGGRTKSRSLEGIPVPPRSVVKLSLSQLDPGRDSYVIHVIATSGQVASTLITRGQEALDSLGLDALAPVTGPSRNPVVGMIPAGAEWARLSLLSPGVPTAVHISLSTEDGVYALAGAEDLTLDADKVWEVKLPKAALVGDLAVLIEADTPVLAGVALSLNVKRGSDIASAAMLSPVYRAASLTIDPAVSLATALLRSEVASTVNVVVRTGSKESRDTIILKPGVITRIKLAAGSGDSHIAWIEPAVDGEVTGSVLLQRASEGIVATALEPLISVRGYVAVPPVAPATSR